MPDDAIVDQFGIRQIPLPETISGLVALVIRPDPPTIQAAYRLAAALVRPGSEQVLGPGSLPHVTLAQCALRAAPRERLQAIVARLEEALVKRSLQLGSIVRFGQGFVFWCVEADGPRRRALQVAHDDALAVAEGFLDPVANAAVVEATRRALGADPELLDNTRRYGYSLVGQRYVPHITLGFDSRPDDAPAARPTDPAHAHTMVVDRIVVAPLGAYGRVDAIYSLD
jgi:2'-5' RNA ligase